MGESVTEITQLLGLVRNGDPAALDQVFDRVYPELKRLAASQLMRTGQTLTPTALVNETYLKLIRADQLDLVDRRHFMICAARAMRHIVIDHHRAASAHRRGGEQQRVTLSTLNMGSPDDDVPDLIELDRALNDLNEIDPNLVELVELKFFAGLTMTEISNLCDDSLRTVNRNWARARAFLNAQLA